MVTAMKFKFTLRFHTLNIKKNPRNRNDVAKKKELSYMLICSITMGIFVELIMPLPLAWRGAVLTESIYFSVCVVTFNFNLLVSVMHREHMNTGQLPFSLKLCGHSLTRGNCSTANLITSQRGSENIEP